jgi:uncharacterized FlaG/YvyC family protein
MLLGEAGVAFLRGDEMNVTSIAHTAPQVHAAAGPKPAAAPSEQQRSLIRAVATVNAAQAFGSDNEVTYQVDRKAQQVVVRVVNRKSGQLISQIPAEYLLRMAEKVNGG